MCYNLELNLPCLISVEDIRCCRKIHILAKYIFSFCLKYYNIFTLEIWFIQFSLELRVCQLTYSKIDFLHLNFTNDIIMILKVFTLESFLYFIFFLISHIIWLFTYKDLTEVLFFYSVTPLRCSVHSTPVFLRDNNSP